jgi:predicted metal-dependent phosphoesterase TrpH
MTYADLHVHSNFSHDGTASIQSILQTAVEQTNLSILAITDHDEIAGALLAEKMAPSFGIKVITGSEVTTSEGHLLALFIREKVPAGLSLIDTLIFVDKLGGVCIAPHPGAKWTNSLSLDVIQKAMRHPIGKKVLVGMEIFNAGLFRADSNEKAKEFALNHDISICANSDAHVTGMIGRAATCFSGNSIEDLRKALTNRKTSVFRTYHISKLYIIFSWLYGRIMLGFTKQNRLPSTGSI